jgi:hypothetical protein
MFVLEIRRSLNLRGYEVKCGGWGEIRTHGELTPTPVFKTGAINRSATHPRARNRQYLTPIAKPKTAGLLKGDWLKPRGKPQGSGRISLKIISLCAESDFRHLGNPSLATGIMPQGETGKT